MFNFLKEKLKSAVARFTREVEEKGEEVVEEEYVAVSSKKKKETAKERPAAKKTAAKEKKKPVQKKRAKLESKPAKEEIKKIKKEKKETAPPPPQPAEEVIAAPSIPETVTRTLPRPEAVEEKRGFFGKLKEKLFKAETAEEAEEQAGEQAEEQQEKKAEEAGEEEQEAPSGFFQRIREAVTKKTLSESQFEEMFWDLEVALLENNVAVEVIEKIKQDLKLKLVNGKVPRGKVQEAIQETLGESIASLFDVPPLNLLEMAKKKKPYVITFVGVNGSGKTTTIAKLAHLFQQHGMKPVMAAGDTFRAAAIQQLEEHANRLGVKLIRHDYGADPAAVAFDAIKYAEAHKADVVLIDTAGRLHSNINLMDEMKKIMRVAKPDAKIFIGESITGNDCIEQARQFNDAIGIDGIILCKADVDEKGGAAISVSYVTGKPILYLGTGQKYEDLQAFDPAMIVENLGLEG